MTGAHSENFDPVLALKNNAYYTDHFQAFIRERPHLMRNVFFAGPLRWGQYRHVLQGAEFFWHNVVYDNGTAGCFEAAQLGVPSLSSDYPQMHYFDAQFGTNVRFFSAFDIKAGVHALQAMTAAAKNGLRATYGGPAATIGEQVAPWFAALIEKLVAPASTQSPRFDALSIRLAEALGGSNLKRASKTAAYVRAFPFEDAARVCLMLDGAIAHEDVVSALDILLALARERYVSFKLFVFVDLPPDAIAVIEEFVYANVVHNDFFIVGGEVNSVLRATALDGAHLTIALTGNGAASIDLLDESLSFGSPVFVLCASRLPTAGRSGLLDDLVAALAARNDLLNRQRLELAVADRRAPPVAAVVNDPNEDTVATLLRAPPPIPSAPMLVDFRIAAYSSLLRAGFSAHDEGYRWASRTARLVLGGVGTLLGIEAGCDANAFDAAGGAPRLAVDVNGVRVGVVELREGQHRYWLTNDHLEPSEGQCEVTITANFDYRASDDNSRMIAWRAIAVGFATTPIPALLDFREGHFGFYLGDGWNMWEPIGHRWAQGEAHCVLGEIDAPFLVIQGACEERAFTLVKRPQLAVELDGEPLGKITLRPGLQVYWIAVRDPKLGAKPHRLKIKANFEYQASAEDARRISWMASAVGFAPQLAGSKPGWLASLDALFRFLEPFK